MSKYSLALFGGDPAVSAIRPDWPIKDDLDLSRMASVVQSGRWNGLGTFERSFSRRFAEFLGCSFCICTSSGTSALELGLMAVGVRPGDRVVVPSLTWLATAQAVKNIGAQVILADCDAETMCLSPESLTASITENCVAIIPVCLYGSLPDLDSICSIARARGLRIVLDAAHQPGSHWKGKDVSSYVDVACYSFELSKILTCGEGGALCCSERSIYEKAFQLSHFGLVPEAPFDYPFDRLVIKGGYYRNAFLTEMQACLLVGGVERLCDLISRQEKAVRYIAEMLTAIDGPLTATPPQPAVTRQTYYRMGLAYDNNKARGLHRNLFVAALSSEGVEFEIPYCPLHLHPASCGRRVNEASTLDCSICGDHYPNSELLYKHKGVLLDHVELLGSAERLSQVSYAVEKVSRHIDDVREYFVGCGEIS